MEEKAKNRMIAPHFQRRIVGNMLILLLLTLISCSNAGNHAHIASSAHNSAPPVGTPIPVDRNSTITFTLSGGSHGSDTVSASTPTSKLRHGHREFTIDIANRGKSVFIVFYGYQGPGNYTLAPYLNGGDVHIGLTRDGPGWDLTQQIYARCQLTISSETPTRDAGLDRMQGRFSCPQLFSSVPDHPAAPISVDKGAFDIAIIVES